MKSFPHSPECLPKPGPDQSSLPRHLGLPRWKWEHQAVHQSAGCPCASLKFHPLVSAFLSSPSWLCNPLLTPRKVHLIFPGDKSCSGLNVSVMSNYANPWTVAC